MKRNPLSIEHHTPVHVLCTSLIFWVFSAEALIELAAQKSGVSLHKPGSVAELRAAFEALEIIRKRANLK